MKLTLVCGGLVVFLLLTAFTNMFVALSFTCLYAYLAYRWYATRRLPVVKKLRDLRSLTPKEFELAVAEILRRLGYKNVRVVGGASDLAADIICEDPLSVTKFVVQCKQWRKPVGSPEIQKFIGMAVLEHKANGIFVTTSYFTQPAKALAKKHGIRLIDGAELAKLAVEVEKLPRVSRAARAV